MDATPYIVSARKYRPKDFEAVVGQSHVTDTLEHEVASGHLAQALLFTGPRGVGKTTCARILARRINEVHTGPDQDYSLNIFELDAASNNSVDDIRQLIDQVRFAPQVGRFKVYIIDEVHMLSQAAFNAFLKTLEEPPAHAIFILATTEKHKVLPTILSRCQIFDFKRIGLQDIAHHLRFVADKEGIQAEEEALHAIAEKADGALRDSLSIFDRVAAFARGGVMTYDIVRENLQLLDRSVFFQSVEFMLAGNNTGLLLQMNEVLDRGFDLHRYIGGLASHVRDILLAKHDATVVLMDVPDSVKAQYREQAAAASPGFLATALKALSQCDLSYRASSNPRLLVEIALLELAGYGQGEDLAEKKKPSPAALNPTQDSSARSTPESAPSQPSEPTSASEVSPPSAIPTPGSPVEPALSQNSTPAEPVDRVENDASGPQTVSSSDSITLAKASSATTPEHGERYVAPASLAEAFDGPSDGPATSAEGNSDSNDPGAGVMRSSNGSEKGATKVETLPASESPRKSRSMFSLKAQLRPQSGTEVGEEIVASQAPIEIKRVSPFSQNALETAWMDAVKTMEDRPIIHSVIAKTIPVLEDEFRVRISVENRVQADYLDGVRDELVGVLRAALENDAVRLMAVVEEGSSNAKIVYTPEERYQFLLEKNSHLAEFRREFKLDLE